MKRTYLALYNALQFIGWSWIFLSLLRSVSIAYIVDYVYFFQFLAFLEILHSAFGIVSAGIVPTSIQVISRIQVLVVAYLDKRIYFGFPMVLTVCAWTSIEIVRYLYLFRCVCFDPPPRVLLWLRYSLFYFLYPLGVYGEMSLIWSALGVIDEKKFLSIGLPNSFNFEFSFSAYLRFLLYVLYLPGLALQYIHMIKQRRKALTRKKSL